MDSEGGVERALASLLDALSQLGCESTVLASGDSAPTGELIPVVEAGLAGDQPPGIPARLAHMHEVMWASAHARWFDVVHCHIPPTGYVLGVDAELRRRLLHTAHGPVSDGLKWLVTRHPGHAFTSVTRRACEQLRRAGAAGCRVIPEAVVFSRLALHPSSGETLVFTGEISRQSAAEAAIGAAVGLRRRITLVGPVPAREESFFRDAIEPRLNQEVQYRGDLSHAESLELLANAACAVLPAQPADCFSLAAVEAMACGTPTVGLAAGAAREVVQPGLTGYVADAFDGLAGAVQAAAALDRAGVRSGALSQFDGPVIAGRYLRQYEEIARRGRAGGATATTGARRSPARGRRTPLRVLQVGRIQRPVKPGAPHGIEAMLAALIAALRPLGCTSTLVAAGGSEVDGAEVVPVLSAEEAADLSGKSLEEVQAYAVHAVMEAMARGARLDLIHTHSRDAWLLSGFDDAAGRVLHTLHHPASPPVCWIASHHPQMRFAVPSEFQAVRLRQAGVTSVHVVPNGVDLTQFPFRADPTGQLAFLGALKPQKGPDIALRVASEARLPITLAGPVDGVSRHFFDTRIRPRLNGTARYVGVLGLANKIAFLGAASCLVMPSRWEEPFGMVAVEAMACGTPVVGLANGALPEIVEEGVGGYLATSENEMPGLVLRARRLDRRQVRAYAASRFDILLTARRYAELYREMAAQ